MFLSRLTVYRYTIGLYNYVKDVKLSLSYTDIDQCHCWRNLTYQQLVCQISPTVTLIDISMSLS